MNEPQMTEEQEALLDEALKYAQLAEQQARELSAWADAFAAKWEKRLREAEEVVVLRLREAEEVVVLKLED